MMVRLIINTLTRLYVTKNDSKGMGYRLAPASLFILTFLLFVCTTPVKSQLISISSRFDTTSIWIGEHTNFSFTLEQPVDIYIDFPHLTDTLSAKIEILSEWPADTLQIGDNKIKIKKSYRVTSFNQGEHYVNPLQFLFFIDDEERVLNTNPVRLEVLSPEIDREGGIYDIKSPLGIPLGFFEILPWIILTLFVALSVWFIIRYLRQSKKKSPLSNSLMPSEPAHVIALRELKQLKSESLWQKGMIKEYYTRLTEIVRIYIERRFAIMAMERTSDEIISDLRKMNSLGGEVIDLLGECFSLADLVKFAKARPVESDHESCLNTAFHFVKASFDSKSHEGNENNGNSSALPDIKEEEEKLAFAEKKENKNE